MTDRIFEIIGRKTRKPNGWLGKINSYSMAEVGCMRLVSNRLTKVQIKHKRNKQ